MNIRLRLFQPLDLNTIFLCIIPERCMNCLFRKQRTVNLYRRKTVKGFHNSFICHLHCFFNIFSFYKFRCHTARSNRCAAAKCFKFYITDNLIFINVQINSHNISAFRISYCSNAAGIFNLSYISWMFKMIHYFFCIHNLSPVLSFILFLFLFLYKVLI